MTLACPHTEFLLPPSSLYKRAALPSPNHLHPAWKRRRVKPSTVHSQFNFSSLPIENLFHTLLSQLPSVNNLNYIVPTFGLASGLALFFSSKSAKLFPNPKNNRYYNSDVGEWILFSSPTPFNRFVILRCSSIYFPGSDLLESVSEKLVKEDRHYVSLNSGRIVLGNGEDEIDGKMVYQRVCVGTEDGGTLSLDWPDNLDLEGERGFDTTVLIVPGTAEGSNEWKIRGFVIECLRRGVFPVVMNPRGCAGSPLTTARLFTAADSDDISVAVRFIHQKRPWTTLMSVGWGYGANMLTKYLAEFGEKTPLTAATCIDNPFDLEEAARSSLYHMSFDQRLTRGLINILQCNKELFQGRGKGFDVEKALSASSILDFDKAISMVSYGFDTIEDFYEKSSTRDVVGKVKIPVLFIQNDDETVPLFSIPRGLIAENPYTSLLLCSYSPSSRNSRLNFSWCLNLTIEWLAAVELGLLKGRHPLLKDVDFAINPSKGLALVDGRASRKNDSKDKLLSLTTGYSAKNSPSKIQSKSAQDIGRLRPEIKGLQEEHSRAGRQPNSVDAEVQEEEGANSFHNERGQVLQTAQVVMNMLDVTMPDTLSEEQKKKVLNAVGQGEMLMKALQDAVPEDVREKLSSSVVGIVQSQGSNLKFDELLRLGHIPNVASVLNSKLKEEIKLSAAAGDEEVHSSDQNKRSNDRRDDPGVVDHSSDKLLEYTGVENQVSENLEKPNETGSIQSTSSHWSNNPDSEYGDQKDNENNFENEQLSRYNLSNNSDDRQNVPETSADREFSTQYEDPDGTEDISSHPKQAEREYVKGQPHLMEENNKHNHDSSTDQSKETEVCHTEVKSSAPSSSSDSQLTENEAENNENKEEKDPQPVSRQDNAASPSFSVSQALDALTGFDDSTQVAVNSVFHVIECMINQLEVKKDYENEVKDGNNILDVNKGDKAKKLREGSFHLKDHDHKSEKKENLGSNPTVPSDSSSDLFNPEGSDDNYKLYKTYNGHCHDSSLTCKENHQIGTTANFAKFLNNFPGKVPGCLTTFPYGDPLYKEYLKSYLLSEMRNAKPLDLDTKSALYLDYFPEDGQWKLLEQVEDNICSAEEFPTHEGPYRDEPTDAHSRSKHINNIIEPSYVILDSGERLKQNEEIEEMNVADEKIEFDGNKLDESRNFVKNIILECLSAEVGRRVNASDMEQLKIKIARDIEHVANTVSLAAREGKEHVSGQKDHLLEKLGSLHGENIIKAISFAVQDTPHLREVLPVGVIVGSTLASLRKFFVVSSLDYDDKKDVELYQVGKLKKSLIPVDNNEINERLPKKIEGASFGPAISKGEDEIVFQGSSSNKIMVGAVTAALGASALLAHQQNAETDGNSMEPPKDEENSKEPSMLEEMAQKNNLVTSLAEKAMSVASPVVPIKEDGEIDHERLVAMLAELGQKGGVLKLVGKVALLWGGIRGAMSLTDKLISFLQIAERPLFQRILGFVFMVLLLWSPVIVPLFPSLMRSWATQNPSKVVELASIAGLYVSVMLMVMLWGKRIRKYDDPLLQYGLDLTSIPKFQNFLKGLAGGAMLVLLIHSANSSLGCMQLCWPATLSASFSEPVTLMKSYARMFLLIVQGIVTATGVATVEELLFRSWLPQEIAADFGYHRGIIISGLAFSLSQRSIWEIPGLWLLSLSLSGAQQRSQGSLLLPIGLRTGILASNFFLKMGGFLTCESSLPLWIMGGHPFQPFSGVVGLAFSLVLAIIMYPRQPLERTKTTRVIIG